VEDTEGSGFTWLTAVPEDCQSTFDTVSVTGLDTIDLIERESSLEVDPGVPIIVGYRELPNGNMEVDTRIIHFANDPVFGAYGRPRGTQDVFRYQLPIFFRWLDGRGRPWDQVTIRDFAAYKLYRTRKRRVSDQTWDKDYFALDRFYKWAKADGHMDESPIPIRDQKQDPKKKRMQVAGKNAITHRWRWATPGTFVLWREVGFRGYLPTPSEEGRGYEVGFEDETYRGHNIQRNVTYVDLVWSSALRRQEAGTLLLPELPETVSSEPILARKMAKKGRARRWRSANETIAQINAYIHNSRAAAVRRAQHTGLYDSISPLWVTDFDTTSKGRTLTLADGSKMTVAELTIEDRMRLFREDASGRPEPLWLWLQQNGMPLQQQGWNKIFERANQRFSTELARVGRTSDVDWLSPHSLRFSYGLNLLIALHRIIDKDPNAITGPGRYDAAYSIVASLMGHANPEVTKTVYLEPLSQDRLWESVAFTNDDIATALEDIAMRDPRVLDLAEGWRG
jgi:integrase